jgi:hypothetical protein
LFPANPTVTANGRLRVDPELSFVQSSVVAHDFICKLFANRKKNYLSEPHANLIKSQITFYFQHRCGATATHNFFNYGQHKKAKHLLKQT